MSVNAFRRQATNTAVPRRVRELVGESEVQWQQDDYTPAGNLGQLQQGVAQGAVNLLLLADLDHWGESLTTSRPLFLFFFPLMYMFEPIFLPYVESALSTSIKYGD